MLDEKDLYNNGCQRNREESRLDEGRIEAGRDFSRLMLSFCPSIYKRLHLAPTSLRKPYLAWRESNLTTSEPGFQVPQNKPRLNHTRLNEEAERLIHTHLQRLKTNPVYTTRT